MPHSADSGITLGRSVATQPLCMLIKTTTACWASPRMQTSRQSSQHTDRKLVSFILMSTRNLVLRIPSSPSVTPTKSCQMNRNVASMTGKLLLSVPALCCLTLCSDRCRELAKTQCTPGLTDSYCDVSCRGLSSSPLDRSVPVMFVHSCAHNEYLMACHITHHDLCIYGEGQAECCLQQVWGSRVEGWYGGYGRPGR